MILITLIIWFAIVFGFSAGYILGRRKGFADGYVHNEKAVISCLRKLQQKVLTARTKYEKDSRAYEHMTYTFDILERIIDHLDSDISVEMFEHLYSEDVNSEEYQTEG